MQDPPSPDLPSAQPSAVSFSGARCAVHPELPAGAVCARCGNFMCATCSDEGRSKYCSQCRARGDASDFPFSRASYTLQGLVDYCWRRWKAHWLTLSLAALLFIGVIYAFAAVAGFGSAILTVAAGHGREARSISPYSGCKSACSSCSSWCKSGCNSGS